MTSPNLNIGLFNDQEDPPFSFWSFDFLENENQQFCFGCLKGNKLCYIKQISATDKRLILADHLHQLEDWDLYYRLGLANSYPIMIKRFNAVPVALIPIPSKYITTAMDFKNLNQVSIFKDLKSTASYTIFQVHTSEVPLEVLLELDEIKSLIDSGSKHSIIPISGKGYIFHVTNSKL